MSGVASRRQSRPQVVHSTVRSWSRFAARSAPNDEDAERRAEPPRRLPGGVGDGVAGAGDVVGGDAWRAAQHVAVGVAVHRDLVAGGRDFSRERRARGAPCHPA